MTAGDLRDFLAFVREHTPREYLRVRRSVSPDWEMAAVVAKLEAGLRAPVIEFTEVQGTTLPVVTNVCASLSRIARAAGLSQGDLEDRLRDAYDRPLAPRLHPSPRRTPIRQNLWLAEQADLEWLPRIRYTAVETAPYLTATAVVARDPVSGVTNVSYHRMMIVDRRTTAIFLAPGGHLAGIVARYQERGQATPVAAFIGAHPLWSLGTLAGGGPEVDELAVIGGILGEPLEVVPGLVDDRLIIPANAEIALEGYIHGDRLVPEGPYGEFAGYAMREAPRPTFEVTVVSCRTEPIFQDIVAGRLEHLTMTGTAIKVHLRRTLAAFPAVRGIHLPAPMTLFVQVDTAALGRHSVREVLRAVLASEPYIKQVYCFDTDIDLRSVQQTQWAIATRAQVDRDLMMLPPVAGMGMDPSEQDRQTVRWGLDATAKPDLARFPARNPIPKEVLERINLGELLAKG